MSAVSNRLSIDQSRATRMIRIVQDIPFLKVDAFGGAEFCPLSKTEKATAVAKIISDLGDSISKESGLEILQYVQAGNISFEHKIFNVYMVLKKHFPHLQFPIASEEELRKWELEQLAESVLEYMKKTPGFPGEGLSVKDSLAYQVLVKECGVPAHTAEHFLYRIKIGEETYTFIGDPHEINELNKCRAILQELARSKKCVFSFEGLPNFLVDGNLLSPEGNSIHYPLGRILLSFLDMMEDRESDHTECVKELVSLLSGFPKAFDLWCMLSHQVKTNAEFHKLFVSINAHFETTLLLDERVQKIAKLGTRKQWLVIYKQLIELALKKVKLSDAYKASLETLLKDHTNEKACQDFYREAGLVREEVMAGSLFACKFPGERIAFIGASHIPGVVAHLKRLAKSGSVVVSTKPDDKKSSETASPEKDLPTICALKLEDLIPNTKWSKNAKTNKVWFEGTEEKTKEIAGYLNAHGIKVGDPAKTKNSTYLVIIENPDLALIEKLPPYEQWLKKKAEKV